MNKTNATKRSTKSVKPSTSVKRTTSVKNTKPTTSVKNTKPSVKNTKPSVKNTKQTTSVKNTKSSVKSTKKTNVMVVKAEPKTVYNAITKNIYHTGSSYRCRVSVKGTLHSRYFSNKRKAISWRNTIIKSR